MARREELSDEQWAVVEPLLPKPRVRSDRRGRPRRGNREIFNGILWILRWIFQIGIRPIRLATDDSRNGHGLE
jgi:hypothetical protein